MALITCKDLAIGFDGHPLVEDLNFSVSKDDYLCIVGENGSGKTTLMRTLLNLIPPLSGKIEMGEGLRRTQIGYLPQQTSIQRDFPASVSEIVLSGCRSRLGHRPFYGRAEHELANDALHRLNIADLARASYRELSGGQQQRVLLARALCATRALLLLDEPVTGLDPQASAEMYRLISQLHREDGVAIIMITHDLSASLKYATHILHIDQQAFYGTREEYSVRPSGFGAKQNMGVRKHA